MTAADTRRRILRRLKKARLDPAPDVVEGLVVYYDLLRRWNEKINLTSLPDGDEALDRLLVEPLIAARSIPDAASLVVDIGSGGGSPAIPLKLASPTIGLWMVESKVRKSAFLREAIRELSLSGVTVETGRFEESVKKPEFFGRVDVLTLRAVRADLKLLAVAQHALRAGGQFFFFTKANSASRLLVPPHLEFAGEETLLPALQSSLVRLRKRPTGEDTSRLPPAQ